MVFDFNSLNKVSKKEVKKEVVEVKQEQKKDISALLKEYEINRIFI